MSTNTGEDQGATPVINLNPQLDGSIGTIVGYFDGKELALETRENLWVYVHRDETGGTYRLCVMDHHPNFKPVLIAEDGDLGQALVMVSNFVREAIDTSNTRGRDVFLGCAPATTQTWRLWKMALLGIDGESVDVYFQFDLGEVELFNLYTAQRDVAIVEQAASLLGRMKSTLAKRLKGKPNKR